MDSHFDMLRGRKDFQELLRSLSSATK
jgi:hypothetical protein